MRVGLAESITSQQTRAEQVRKGAKLVDGKTIRALLEKIADPDKPLVIAVYEVKKDRLPGDFYLRECRGIFIYQSRAFLDAERERCAKEGKAAALATRTARLDQIKSRLWAELKADDDSFDKKYDAQTEERVAIAEAEVERAALVILAEEEN